MNHPDVDDGPFSNDGGNFFDTLTCPPLTGTSGELTGDDDVDMDDFIVLTYH